MSKIEVNAIEPQSGTTLTLGASGDTVTLAAGASQSGFGRTGTVNWDTTAKTTGFTAVSGVGYFCDTTSAAFTVTLPATPTAGDIVAIADYANTFATNNLTVGRNGSKIGSLSINAILSTNGLSVTFVYVDSTQGWIVTDSGNRSDLPTPQFIAATGGTITTCGSYKIHTFTGPGTFTVSCVGNPAGSTTIEYLVVAGGAGGGGAAQVNTAGGGGGAGGFRQNYPSPVTTGLPVTATSYPITVGGGGAGGPGFNPGTSGSNSIFSTITSSGGGGGSAYPGSGGLSGGSGGGGSSFSPTGLAGGAGNTPPVSPSQGNPGGPTTASTQNSTVAGGGGGGSGGTGGTGSPNTGGTGGAGTATSISGTSITYAAGGGGSGSTPGVAGNPSAGNGAVGPTADGSSATTNRGGGGGGGITGPTGSNTGGSGGSGIVIIRYKYQ